MYSFSVLYKDIEYYNHIKCYTKTSAYAPNKLDSSSTSILRAIFPSVMQARL